MLLLEMPLKNNDFEDLTKMLPEDSYLVVTPKFMDGEQIIQVVIDLAKDIVPALVFYLVGRKHKRNTATATIVAKTSDGKIDYELTAQINIPIQKNMEAELTEVLTKSLMSLTPSEKEETEGNVNN